MEEVIISKNVTPLKMVINVSYMLMFGGEWVFSELIFNKFVTVKEGATYKSVLREEYENYSLEQLRNEMYSISNFKELYEIKFKEELK